MPFLMTADKYVSQFLQTVLHVLLQSSCVNLTYFHKFVLFEKTFAMQFIIVAPQPIQFTSRWRFDRNEPFPQQESNLAGEVARYWLLRCDWFGV